MEEHKLFIRHWNNNIMQQDVFNAYRIMWLFIFFDLPVKTDEQRKIANDFRKSLLCDGFQMFQLSVYARPCFSKENAEVHIRRIQSVVPSEGKVSILTVTDKQFSLIKNIWGKVKRPPPDTPQQLLLF